MELYQQQLMVDHEIVKNGSRCNVLWINNPVCLSNGCLQMEEGSLEALFCSKGESGQNILKSMFDWLQQVDSDIEVVESSCNVDVLSIDLAVGRGKQWLGFIGN